ncbi:MAG: DNA mismatch endonuclease Vsr [Phenylobacterium sp.]|nr:DNA mismatch endonuclease Vsr [Phenylobacterium sp.]MCW5758438.1 DNA mismatch endonuclease Vsr [Phenylobacterium sp.]
MDPLTPEQRRLNMSRVRGKNTKPELLIRRALHAAGLRYRLHGAKLPGKPDLVFPARRAVIFVHGCFWHGHHCPLFRLPATRTAFWSEKIESNRTRDAVAVGSLRSAGWRVLTIWECALRGPARRDVTEVTAVAANFIRGDAELAELEGEVPSQS